ncbi:MAG: rod shape-determining protein RodA [Lachnospiraceae bacterium]|nr:rod shape-determining protein RodA [Lachnospiraceae bacterium]
MLFDEYQFKNYNFRLIFYILLLNVLGVLVISSATGQESSLVSKQIMGIVVGFMVVILLSLLDYHRILSLATLVYVACVIGLIAVLMFGENVNNATRWLKLPGIGQIQPSEFVKVGLIVFFAWFFSKKQAKLNYLTTLLLAGALLLVVFGLIYEEPDLSTGLVIVFVFTCMLFAAGLSYRWILGGLAILVPVGTLFIYLLQYDKVPFLKGYQARRILAFFFKEKYAEANLQQDNSIMAIGSGMLHGKGLNYTANSVKNGNFLSEEQTDFIFAVIGEELGFVGCTMVILLIALIVYECLIMAAKTKDMAGRLLCVGMAALLAFQSFSNIAVATGVFPNTGLPLPFISYGVSSLISMYIGIGITLNVGLQRKISN